MRRSSLFVFLLAALAAPALADRVTLADGTVLSGMVEIFCAGGGARRGR